MDSVVWHSSMQLALVRASSYLNTTKNMQACFSPCAAELFASIFHSFEAGIASAIPASNE